MSCQKPVRKSGPKSGPPNMILDGSERVTANRRTRKTRDFSCFAYPTVPPQGLEQSLETREISDTCGDVPLLVPPSRSIRRDAKTAELLAVWTVLDEPGRADLLAVAHGLIATLKAGIASPG
jgi:hypothetical protein